MENNTSPANNDDSFVEVTYGGTAYKVPAAELHTYAALGAAFHNKRDIIGEALTLHDVVQGTPIVDSSTGRVRQDTLANTKSLLSGDPVTALRYAQHVVDEDKKGKFSVIKSLLKEDGTLDGERAAQYQHEVQPISISPVKAVEIFLAENPSYAKIMEVVDSLPNATYVKQQIMDDPSYVNSLMEYASRDLVTEVFDDLSKAKTAYEIGQTLEGFRNIFDRQREQKQFVDKAQEALASIDPAATRGSVKNQGTLIESYRTLLNKAKESLKTYEGADIAEKLQTLNSAMQYLPLGKESSSGQLVFDIADPAEFNIIRMKLVAGLELAETLSSKVK